MNQTTPPVHFSEEDILRLVASMAGGAVGRDTSVGIGDDAAILLIGGSRVAVTTDMMIEGVHFDQSFISPYDIGRRAMAANLSDLAAMGAAPRWGFLSLGLPPKPTGQLVEDLIRGMMDLGQKYGLNLVGGDTVGAPVMILNLCIMGVCDPVKPALRKTARPGEAVCVSGPLGASGAGLAWLLGGGDPDQTSVSEAVEAHLRPIPRVELGRALAKSDKIGAMMDLSDGLATDLARLCQASDVGARIEEAKLPVSAQVACLAAGMNVDVLDWALRGGEDFELLFTCQPGDVALLQSIAAESDPSAKIVRVGTINKGRGVSLLSRDGEIIDVGLQGYDHFRQDDS